MVTDDTVGGVTPEIADALTPSSVAIASALTSGVVKISSS